MLGRRGRLVLLARYGIRVECRVPRPNCRPGHARNIC